MHSKNTKQILKEVTKEPEIKFMNDVFARVKTLDGRTRIVKNTISGFIVVVGLIVGITESSVSPKTAFHPVVDRFVNIFSSIDHVTNLILHNSVIFSYLYR